MSINTSSEYIIIGTDENLNNSLKLPVPNSLPFSNEFMAEAERNADGTMAIQQIGRTQYVTEIKWSSLPNRTWWDINNWFETYGYVFYMKYFNHATGKIQIRRFYRGNISKATPSTTTETIQVKDENYQTVSCNVPKRYKDCGFNIIDMGED